jgi:hypothetical protein
METITSFHALKGIFRSLDDCSHPFVERIIDGILDSEGRSHIRPGCN